MSIIRSTSSQEDISRLTMCNGNDKRTIHDNRSVHNHNNYIQYTSNRDREDSKYLLGCIRKLEKEQVKLAERQDNFEKKIRLCSSHSLSESPRRKRQKLNGNRVNIVNKDYEKDMFLLISEVEDDDERRTYIEFHNAFKTKYVKYENVIENFITMQKEELNEDFCYFNDVVRQLASYNYLKGAEKNKTNKFLKFFLSISSFFEVGTKQKQKETITRRNN